MNINLNECMYLFNIYNTFKRINVVCDTFCLSFSVAHETEIKEPHLLRMLILPKLQSVLRLTYLSVLGSSDLATVLRAELLTVTL